MSKQGTPFNAPAISRITSATAKDIWTISAHLQSAQQQLYGALQTKFGVRLRSAGRSAGCCRIYSISIQVISSNHSEMGASFDAANQPMPEPVSLSHKPSAMPKAPALELLCHSRIYCPLTE